jgi:allophanate hydrolase
MLLATLRRQYLERRLTPTQLVETVEGRLQAAGDDAVWISRVPGESLREAASAVEQRAARDGIESLPLYGIPFAVKDNIDVAGLPTTAACPAFAYMPARSATAVERLLEAGALLVGKTNLDQFATGLSGTRSPYGVPRNPFGADFIPGGSSSGSAVAVATGLVSFALGTDTAGLGRIPAAFNNIVGLKSTRGLVSAAGVVPACRSLDCVSIFALSVADAAAVLDAAAGVDAADPFSRPAPAGFAATVPASPQHFVFGVPRPADLRFFGNAEGARLFAQAIRRLEQLGGSAVEIDYSPFAASGELLYGGPWVAERTAALGDFLDTHAQALLPATREIIGGGTRFSAVDAFRALYRLEELRAATRAAWKAIDFLLVPTAGTIYRLSEIEAEPIALNDNLGYYANFVNLLDLAAIAVPGGFDAAGLPAGVTLIAPAWQDMRIAAVAARFHAVSDLPLGATGAATRALAGG